MKRSLKLLTRWRCRPIALTGVLRRSPLTVIQSREILAAPPLLIAARWWPIRAIWLKDQVILRRMLSAPLLLSATTVSAARRLQRAPVEPVQERAELVQRSELAYGSRSF